MNDKHDWYEPDLAKALKTDSVNSESHADAGEGKGDGEGVAAPKAKAVKRKKPEASSGANGADGGP